MLRLKCPCQLIEIPPPPPPSLETVCSKLYVVVFFLIHLYIDSVILSNVV